MKMKRILVKVKAGGLGRGSTEIDSAIWPLLTEDCNCDFWRTGDSYIYFRSRVAAIGCCQPLLVDFDMPAKFVLELPAYLVRKGVPEYTGPIKRKTSDAESGK